MKLPHLLRHPQSAVALFKSRDVFANGVPTSCRALAAALLLSAAPMAFANTQGGLLFESTFESGLFDGWEKVRTNVPLISTERARAGRFSMKTTLDISGAMVKGGERNEMKIKIDPAPMKTSQWYGFSIFLPSDFVADNVWELVAQWYAVEDVAAEASRQPTMSLFTTDGKWTVGIKYSSEAVTPLNHPSIKQKTWEISSQQLNKWTDWVFNVRWSHESDGFIKAWMDGKQVLDYKGPTSYNDKKGPVVKLGIYKGWSVGDGTLRRDKATRRTLFIDEVRVAGPSGSYAAVAPGGNVADPRAPNALLVQ